MRSGIYKKTIDKKYSFNYFVPTKLNDLTIYYDSKLVKFIENVYKKINKVNKIYESFSIKKKKQINDILLDEESKFSTYLAYGANLNELNLNDKTILNDTNNLYNTIKNVKKYIKDIPISKRLFKDIHYDVCKDISYAKKYPGQFRYTPAWFGFKDSNIDNAFIVFPSENELMDLLTDLENFIHYNEDVPDLIKLVLVHYQFEVIHPFIDGNGRVGRLLFLLLLNEFNLLDIPFVPISKIYHKHATMYYKSFEIVEKEGNFEEFIVFHIKCLNECLNDLLKQINA